MKRKILCTIALFGLIYQTDAQAPPSTGPGAVISDDWSRSGNFQSTGGNVFGTRWNSPIYTWTGGADIFRSKLNAIFTPVTQYSINGYGWNQDVNTTGYMLLGTKNTSITDAADIYSQKGAFSLLHLNGEGSNFQEYGYRPWMKTGVTFTGNRDLSYFGLRQLGTGEDITETTITWSDNADASNPGPDDMVFRFTSGSGSTAYVTDFSNVTDMDGLHVSRFTSNGRMGLGNTFGVNVGSPAVNYNNPQSLLHMSYQFRTGTTNQPYGFMQISYRRPNGSGTDIIGQGETANDGLRLGIDNTVYTTDGTQHLNGYLRWQENSPFIVQTDWDNVAGGVNNGERMRISSIGAPGVSAPAGAPDNNITRVAISHAGNQPITNPRSLLHLGYNTSTDPIIGAQLDDGWRNWMDVGTFTNNGSDNMYVGLKNEGTDRHDAIVSWGDNQAPNATGGNGPDKLRFIFTSTTTALPPGEGDPVSQSNDGLEVGRFFPAKDTVFTYNVFDPSTSTAPEDYYGRFGVGDFTSQGVNEEPTHKLDVVGNGRFRFLPDSLYIADSLVNNIVMVDSMGVLRWINKDSLSTGNITADNGLSIDPLNSSNVQMGQEYTPGTLAFTGAGELIHYTEVPLREFDLVFSSDNLNIPGQSRISIGAEPFAGSNNANNNLLASAKLNTYNFTEQSGGHFFTYLDPNITGMIIPDMYCGAKGTVLGRHADTKIFGLYGQALSQTNSTRVDGVRGEAYGSGINIGVSGHTRIGVDGFTRGGDFITREISNGVCLPGESIGVYGRADGSSTSNISVYGDQAGSNGCGVANNWAGYFNGDVYVSGAISGPSDATLKTNVAQINNGLDIINQLNPVNFEFDNTVKPRLNLEAGIQYGLIAQEVELVLPELVGSSILPAEYDTLGNMIDPSFEFKTLNYEKFVPILIAGMQEQQTQLEAAENHSDSLENVVTNLNNRLTQLENCLSGILPFLCQLNNSAIAPTQENVQRELAKAIDVQLSDKNNIVLNQNVPNPFAEKTVISYSIPETVGKAQIHFYDGKGTLINTVDIVERGSGEINVYANDLSSGVYTYSLVADGQIVSTKRMMKQ